MRSWHPAQGGSPAWRLGLLAVLIALSAVADVTRWQSCLVLGLLAAFAVTTMPGASRVFLRRLLPLLSFALFGLLLAIASPVRPGEPTVWLSGLHRPLSQHSVTYLLSLWLKSALVVAWVTAFAQGLSERDLLEGLMGLRLPGRVSALCFLMVREVHTVTGAVQRLLRARDARGRPRGLYALRVAAAISQTLLLRLGRRAETQALAMTARGFDGGLPLLQWRTLSFAQGLALLVGGGLAAWTLRL